MGENIASEGLVRHSAGRGRGGGGSIFFVDLHRITNTVLDEFYSELAFLEFI